MLRSPFFRRLLLSYLVLTCGVIAPVALVGAWRLRASYEERTREALRDETRLTARLLAPNLSSARLHALGRQVHELRQALPRRITVVTHEGRVLADSEAEPARMENHRLRPEIITAASQGEGQAVRLSDTVQAEMMYFARRVRGADGQTYFIRLALPLRELENHLRVFRFGIGLAAALALVGAAALSFGFARRHAVPLVELTHFANSLREGDLSQRILRPAGGEMGSLATALNDMADALGRLVAQTNQDKAQLVAVLTSMSEGLMATDGRQRILLTNTAAADLLGFRCERAAGRFLWEIVRSRPIIEAAQEAIADHRPRNLQVGPVAGRHLEVAFRTLAPAVDGSADSAEAEGLVIVVHDITPSVRYQELRKEFVANVSHELRTPLTAIKGFAETLREGALHDPVQGPRFLATIERYVDQLTNLVNDLLELSRLESHPELPRLEMVDLACPIEKAVNLLEHAAQAKSQTLRTELVPDLPPVMGDPDYLERAIANLLDNAVKYTPEGGTIRVSAHADENTVVVEVSDSGIGIPAADLPRIFERFYRVDRSRSREMGGTGLGLSIVKHVAQAHRGSIEVQSTPGQGSTFRLTLPWHSSAPAESR